MKKTMKYLFASGVVLSMLTLISCGDDNTLPKIDGYNSSNEVAKTNLVAHWTFDDTNKERLSNTAATSTYGTVGFEPGRIGSALKLTKGALVYPSISPINTANALNNFTVSLWVNVKGTKGVDGAFTAFFGLIPTGVTDIWGDVMACAETGWHLPNSDTLVVKNLLNTHPVGAGNIIEDNISNGNGTNNAPFFLGAKKWSHYVMTWAAATKTFKIYGDAVSVGSYNKRDNAAELIMAIPVQAVFGSLASSDIGFTGAPAQPTWSPWATASIDDVRVFNTVLTEVEISALFNLGTAGR